MKTQFLQSLTRAITRPIARRRAERRERIRTIHQNARVRQARERVASGYYDRPEVLDKAVMRLIPIVMQPTPLVDRIVSTAEEVEADEHREGIRVYPPDTHEAPTVERPAKSVEDVIAMQARYGILEWDGGI